MADDTDLTGEQDTGADVGHDLEAERTTAPMSEFTAREAGIGFVVALIGVAIAFGIPLVAVAP
ncbi:DUF7550 family protein [Natronorubrum sp. FCH18a]|uniref:DUF7550 family protein n=1 Tax=Natronorubrum sp. FCH18a TaxID=3447018 RepID=UPI003F511997